MEQIYLVLTERCNLKCKQCIRGEKENIDIPFDKIQNILKDISYNFPNSNLVLTGGEPTLHKNIFEIIEESSKYFNRVTLTSNGYTSFYKNLDKIRNLDKIKIQISLDGNQELHNRIRGVDSYKEIFENISRILEKKISFTAATTVNKENYLTLKELYEDLLKVRVENWYVNNTLPFGCSTDNHVKPLDTESWNKLVTAMKINCKKINLKINSLFNIEFLEKKSDEEIFRMSSDRRNQNCGSGKNKIYIYPDLNVYGCTCIKKFPFGNLAEESIENIFKSQNAKFIRSCIMLENSPCKKCRYLNICGGGCLGMSFHVFGKIGMGDSRCPLFKKKIKEGNSNNEYSLF
ncbi:MAG: radical SAM protein [Fusobacteriaceae bacterium]